MFSGCSFENNGQAFHRGSRHGADLTQAKLSGEIPLAELSLPKLVVPTIPIKGGGVLPRVHWAA